MVDGMDIPNTKPLIGAWSRRLLHEVVKMDTYPDGTFGKLKVEICLFESFCKHIRLGLYSWGKFFYA
ncbi:hypothetical protein BS78_02G014000 [Paspalum vaginatum]|nr:hypothetical protein BS78_02G014000 [Paspalum vaginatum]